MRWAGALLLLCVAAGVAADAERALETNALGDEYIGTPSALPSSKGKSKISKVDQTCVVCQYLVQRIKGEMLMNGIDGGVPFTTPGGMDGPAMVGVPSRAPGVANPATLFTPPPVTGNANEATTPNTETTANTETKTGFLEVDAQMEEEDGEEYPGEYLKAMHTKGVHLPIRDRKMMLRHFEPPQIRYADMYNGPARAAKRAQERFEDTEIQTVVYKSLEKICERHMPQPFYHDCFSIIQQYEKIAMGLKWSDRPGAVCIHIGMCPATSYLAKGPHELYRESGAKGKKTIAHHIGAALHRV